MDTYKIAVSNFKTSNKLLPGDSRWAAFNSSFQNLDLESTNIMQAIYDGCSITTQHKNHWRKGENYLCGQHIGMDFDTEDERSTINYLIRDKFIERYAAFIHTTRSHTIENPRARVVFLTDSPIMQPRNYTLAVQALLWIFGAADRQCKDAVRFFYGSPGCEFEYLSNVLPIDMVKKMITNYLETGAQERRKTVRSFSAPANQQDVSEALRLIDPWKIEYDEWLAILMAIHSEFGEAGLELAENWADGKPDEIRLKWRSFKQEGNISGAVHIGTLFAIAKRFGWSKQL